MEANLVVNDDEYRQNECIQRKCIILNALYILASCFSFMAKIISKGRSILMLPNVQLHMYLYICHRNTVNSPFYWSLLNYKKWAASPACLHGREYRYAKGENVFYTCFPFFSLQLIVLKPIIKERAIRFNSRMHEVVFIKTTNQSWAWLRGPGTTTAQAGKKPTDPWLPWGCFGHLKLSVLTHHGHSTADTAQQCSSSVQKSRRFAKSDYQKKNRSSAELTPVPWMFLSLNFYLLSTYLVYLMNNVSM